MHRDGTIWLNTADRLRRLQSVKVTPSKVRPPTSNWHQCDVHEPDLRRIKLRTSVTGIPAPQGTLNEIAERRSAMLASRVSPTVVIGCKDAYLYAGKLHDVTRFDLPELQISCRREQAARACRCD